MMSHRQYLDPGIIDYSINDLVGESFEIRTSETSCDDRVCRRVFEDQKHFHFQFLDETFCNLGAGLTSKIVDGISDIAMSRGTVFRSHFFCKNSCSDPKNSSCVITESGFSSISRLRRRASSIQSSSSSSAKGPGSDAISLDASRPRSRGVRLIAFSSTSASTDILLPKPNFITPRCRSRSQI